MYITLNDRGFADESGYLKCHVCHPQTGEYLGPSDEFISQHTGLPAWAYLNGPSDEPPAGYVWVRDETHVDWVAVEDNRGQVIFDTETKEQGVMNALGPIPVGKTLLQPASPFDRWNGHSWERDDEAEKQATLIVAQQEQSLRLTNASLQIAILKPAVDGGYAKPEHTQLLADWQRCRYELTLVPEQPGWPELPRWPVEPDKVA